VRPPVLLIHGTWSNPDAMSNFLVTSNGTDDPRFFVRPLDYSRPLKDTVVATAPNYPTPFAKIKGNSLGFRYNVDDIKAQISEHLFEFKTGINPISAPVAGIQVDIVAHSLGGDITLFLASSPLNSGAYVRDDNFGQGDVHKMISIDTPYLGSPLATQLLQGYFGGTSNDCISTALALMGEFSLANVTFATLPPASGAVYDLRGDGLGYGMSLDLVQITNPLFISPHPPLPTALIAAYTNTSNLSSVSANLLAANIVYYCGTYAGNPLALNLTTTGWPNVFDGALNDAIVPLNSQLNRMNGLSTTNILSGSLFPGYIHTTGITHLGFNPPTVLDAGSVPAQVIALLNTPVTSAAYNLF